MNCRRETKADFEKMGGFHFLFAHFTAPVFCDVAGGVGVKDQPRADIPVAVIAGCFRYVTVQAVIL